MSTFYLQLIATMLCFLCGALASYCVLIMALEGVRLVLASIVSVGCLPLGLVMTYTAHKERLYLQRN